jgi:predicted TIM-barrel fold metal-dependent hydrolase
MSMPKPHSTVATRMSGIREDWLRRTQEEALEPDLAIVNPHHHVWDFASHRYLLPDLLADTGSGHRIESTVFIECTACYRADGPPELRTLGETEFVNGIAAMSANGGYGPTRVAAGIVGLVDLTIGARAEEVLRAHMAAAGPRFKGIRHAAAWEDKAPEIHNSHTTPPPHLYRDHAKFHEGFAALGRLGWLEARHSGTRRLPQRLPEARRPRHAHQRVPFPPPRAPALVQGPGRCVAALHRYLHRGVRPKRCMFESNFPVDKISGSYAVYWNAFKRLASGASAADKAAFFRDTARAFYRLS